MGLKDVDFDSVFRRLADKRIEDAMREGKFDNLAGAGKPLDLEPMPADENARMTWWALRIMRQNDFTPHEVQWRKALDHLKGRLEKLTDESQLPHIVDEINKLVHQINTLGTNALSTGVTGVNLDEERTRLRARLAP
ncbi:MAG TPA: DUF1992 domain-containing protein [Tepidisphaeraceae bacterium]|jgi:hypothetical protein